MANSANPPGQAQTQPSNEHPTTENATPTPVIRHPIWCETVPDRDRTSIRPDSYAGPAEADSCHRGRGLHVDATDVGLTVALLQAYDLTRGAVMALTPAIEFVARDFAMEGPDVGVDLTPAQAELLVEHLQRTIRDHADDWHLPAGKPIAIEAER